ncbi:ATP-binding cassette sub-family G member 1 [Halotydeus destructor]|nr:ATP-binding cassette sub-family G member 1 [Halotydeus destructor]
MVRSVPQNDSVFEQFTVFENLMFASKMYFLSLSEKQHAENVEAVLRDLDLESTKDNVTKTLSGGQKKRLAIGLEIISHPDILVLDEPTSGLDSATAMTCIKLLKRLATKKSMAVLAIIHQPSNEVFFTFDMLYLLSNAGERLYFGPPGQLLPLLQSKGIKCPTKYSVAEFAIKVANSELKQALVTANGINSAQYRKNVQPNSALNQLRRDTNFSGRQAWLVFVRSFVALNIKSPFLVSSVVLVSLTVLMLSYCTLVPFGKEDGCQLVLNDTLSFNQLKTLCREKFDSINGLKLPLLVPVGYMLLVTTIISAIQFPLHYGIFKRELDNRWYSVTSYLIGKFFCAVVECCIISAACIVILFYTSEQHVEDWRMLSWLSIIILASIYYWSLGFLFGLIFRDDMIMAVLSSIVHFFTLFVSRFFLSYAEMSQVIRLFLPLNVFDLSVSASASVMFGFGRCPPLPANAISVHEALADSRSPFKIVSKSYQDTDFTDDDIARWAPIVDVNATIFLSLKKSLDEYFASQPNLSVPRVASNILEELDVDSDGRQCWKQISLLLLQTAIILVISYVKLTRISR